ncbi:MAG: hypothetical protein JGK17_18175 [Microcoleus sp. PH2017_10_PVI_O_A]|uniref:hypothetical protein n=1 Tax=unclassified Microcoleus TaxID=2642155 RepID=UPI001DED477B|nr:MULTISPECIES: hypothetical protein [unclassified Microcoleus]MCC3407481.1 hypothetical protein [Microcoleus sp. PH2017_10_PVI_O_A]MCC3461527.1 hypothetical protein [Microcoleus sp. PH2017_11_PCY_U_A]MCC3480036.1 hypothetical protein [Microcoleus sp. PH2017_12_PCY_D_A]MCC3560828.1 hypothetical protein [Microcoleus sp. PH2017_27_LUM_O_A]
MNWQRKQAEYEYELSVTSSTEKKFELRIKIEECQRESKRLKESSNNPDANFDEKSISASEKSENLSYTLMNPTPNNPDPKLNPLHITLGILALLGGLGLGYFTVTISSNPPKPPISSTENLTTPIKVDLTVIDIETKQAISDIKVYFLSKGAPTTKMTDDNGYTSIEIPERGDIQVTLSKSGYKTKNFTINLETDKNRTRSEYMEKESLTKDTGKVPDVPLAPSNSSSKPDANTDSSTNRIISESPRANPEKIGELEGSKLFEHSISANLPEQTYHFKLANTSDISLYLDGVSSEAQIVLYKANQAGVVTSYMTMKTASNAKSGVIQEKLETGDYVVFVKLKSRGTKYFLRLFNNTNLAENVDYLQTEKKYTNQTISSQYPEKYYHFKLANPTNVSLRLEGVNSDTQIFLNKADEAGVIRSYITMSSASKAKSGVIQKKLETGDYVVVIRFQARDTNYNLTMSAQ